MKKIIRSIVTALIFSVILALLIPQLLFKGDAHWTYQNDAARVDVSFSGHVKNARVKVEGTDLRVSRPAWLSDRGFQGAVAEFPVSYRNKTYQIELTPEADEWGGDATLIIKFRGKDFKQEGKRVPAWVTFRNITLNGEAIVGEKVVWHNTPFVLKYPSTCQKITLTVNVCKPLTISDISFIKPFIVFLACLMLRLSFSPLITATCRVLESDKEMGILKMVSSGYRNINPVYRRSFWIIFGVLCFAFGFHTIWFMQGNHDWALLEHDQRWLEHAWDGRYMLYSVKVLFAKGIYLPLIYDLITFMTLALNAVLLCRYWKLEKRVIYFVLCGLVLTAQPFTLDIMYFVHMLPEVFIGVTCALAALLLSENTATKGEGHLIKKLTLSLIAIVLVNFSLAVYPVLISTIAVAFLGRLLVQSFDWDGTWQQLKSYSIPFITPLVNILLGVVSYKLIITYVFPVSNGAYNTKTLLLDQVPERLSILLKHCFRSLYEYNFPFITQWVLWVFLGFTIVLTLHICLAGDIKQKIVRLLLLFSSIFATQAAMGIAKTYFLASRVQLFGLVFFEVLVMVLVMKRFKRLRDLTVIAGICVILSSIINDLDCLRVWKLGFDAERMLWNRVLARLEVQKGFDPAKRYDIVQVGRGISMRPRYYTGQKGTHISHLLDYPYDPDFNVFCAQEFYYPTRFRRWGFSSYLAHVTSHHRGFTTRLKRLYKAGVLQKAEVWPKPNGLIVWKDIILFVTDGKELEEYKRHFERELEKK